MPVLFAPATIFRLRAGLFALAVHGALSLAQAAPKKKTPRPADEDEAHHLWRWIEDNGEVVFPLIGFVILGLVLLAVRRGTLSQQEEVRKKAEEKAQIIRLMRSKLSLTAESCAPELGVDRYHAAALLEEMEKEGQLALGRAAGGVATYRLKGL